MPKEILAVDDKPRFALVGEEESRGGRGRLIRLDLPAILLVLNPCLIKNR